MTLSISTLGLFVLLLPGLIFRFSLYHGTLVKRAILASNTIYSSLIIVLFAIGVHVFTWTALSLSLKILNYVSICNFNIFLYTNDEKAFAIFYRGIEYSIVDFSLKYFHVIMIYLGVSILIAWLLAKSIQFLARRYSFFARMLFGPLAPLLKSENVTLLTSFVLTNISHENRRIIYAGFPREIGLKDGSKIDYMVLESPDIFYLKMNRKFPSTSLADARPVSEFTAGFLFIAGSEIENVHFQTWDIEN